MSNATGFGSYSACGRGIGAGRAGADGPDDVAWCRAPVRGAPPRPPGRRLRRPCELCDWVVWELKTVFFLKLPRAESNDAPHGIVRGDANSDPVSGDDLDAEPPHPAAQLCEHLMTRVTLDAVQAPAVYGHHGALDIDQVVLAQVSESFPLRNQCATCTLAGQARNF